MRQGEWEQTNINIELENDINTLCVQKKKKSHQRNRLTNTEDNLVMATGEGEWGLEKA